MSTTQPIAEIAAHFAEQLTKAQRDLVFAIGDGVSDASIVNSSDGDRLFDNGIRSDIRAAGHYFTNLTPLGLAVRSYLANHGGS